METCYITFGAHCFYWGLGHSSWDKWHHDNLFLTVIKIGEVLQNCQRKVLCETVLLLLVVVVVAVVLTSLSESVN